MSTDTPDTSIEAYRETKEDGEDVSLRRRVGEALAEEPLTTHELGERLPEHSANATRPRVNELLRMGCVRREGRRQNPSGHEAYIHHLTPTGEAWLRGEVEPEPDPPVSELKNNVVEAARQVVKDGADRIVLDVALDRLDAAQERRDPEGA